MSKKAIVVNGQHLTLNYSGGAGRYAQQIYRRLIDPKNSALDEFEVRALNFPNPEQKGKEGVGSAKSLISLFKHSLFQCSPPIIFNILQKTYNYVNSHVARFALHSDITNNVCVTSSADLTSTSLIHELTNYVAHSAIGRLSLSPKLALAVTFLDIQDYYYPEYFEDKVLKSRRMTYSFYKDRADIFFALSEFTKQTMIEKLGISSSKIKVIPLAADDLLVPEPLLEISKWVEAFGRYWIYPAKVWKHKNHIFLIEALGKRRTELKRAGVKLLLTGGFSEDDIHHLNSVINNNRLKKIVKVLGFVSDEKLQALLQRAEFLIFPSLFEGFGMPILEAMTLGCPVLSSNAGSLPEIGGDAAVFFDPTSEDELIDLVDSILAGTITDRATMVRKGFENCKRYSWNKTYSETVKVYKELLQ